MTGPQLDEKKRLELYKKAQQFLFDDAKETPEVLSSSYLFPKEKKMIEFEVRP